MSTCPSYPNSEPPPNDVMDALMEHKSEPCRRMFEMDRLQFRNGTNGFKKALDEMLCWIDHIDEEIGEK
jgi:hypothetical protein